MSRAIDISRDLLWDLYRLPYPVSQSLTIRSLDGTLSQSLIIPLIPTTNRENGPPHWVRRKKKQKRPSKFIVLDSRNQGTKQLSHFYNWVWTAYALPPRVDPESSERLNQLGFYRAVIFILTPPFKAALYYTTLLENGQHWRSDLPTPTFSLSPIDPLSFHPLSHLCRHPQRRQEIQLGTILLTLLLFSLHFAVTIELFAIFVKHFPSFSALEQTSPAPDAILIFNDIVLVTNMVQ